MEIGILVGILLVIWYYGATIKDALERNNQEGSEGLSTINGNFEILGNQLYDANQNLNDISFRVDSIAQALKSESINDEIEKTIQTSAFLNKPDDLSITSSYSREIQDELIGANSILNDIRSTLHNISINVQNIADHPTFTDYPNN